MSVVKRKKQSCGEKKGYVMKNKSWCLDDSKIRLSLPKPFRILLKLWKVVGNIQLPFPAYLLYLFARLVAQRDF